MAIKLFVGNLLFDITEKDITDQFSQAGEVQQVELINDRTTGQPRGFGFVTMSDEGARAAISEFNGIDFHGRSLVVNEARERDSSPRGGRNNSGDRDHKRARRY